MFFRKSRSHPVKSSAAPYAAPPALPEFLFAGPFGEQRREMIFKHLWGRDIRNPRVIEAMARVPRERFVAPELASKAYDDSPLEIGEGQTISQPYMVARMTELAEVMPGSRVLEIGSGCGYQTAVLMELGARVIALELRQPLAAAAAARLGAMGYVNFEMLCRDGFGGLPERGPFDAILLGAAPLEIPPALAKQLAPGGRLILPAGAQDDQFLYRITRAPLEVGGTVITEQLFPVRFVPLISIQ